HPATTVDAQTGVPSGLCALPYAVRNLEDPANPASRDLGPRQVVYHLNETFPADLKPAAAELARQYDELFRGIYRGATGRESPSPLFVLCPNNPVEGGDPAVCGPVGTKARVGDIRFNLLAWVDLPTSAELLGYGPTSNDPETGEVISASALVYGASIDTYAAWARDLVRVVNGELSLPDAAAGTDVAAWVSARPYGTRKQAMTQEEVDGAASAMDTSWMQGLPRLPAVRKGNASALRAMRGERHSALAQSPQLRAERGHAARRLQALEQSALLPSLVNDEVLMAQGMDPRSPVPAGALAALKPLQRLGPERSRLAARQRARLGAHAVDLNASLDDSVIGFALAQQGVDPQVVWRRIRELVFLSTALHEVGHTLGLRHNFAASYDPLNYPKTYWDLRTANGTKQPRPRHVDPETQAEREGVVLAGGLRAGISEFMQSSVMDYGAGFNTDIHGLGKYDRAAIKFGYGDLVETFTDVRDGYLMGALQATATYGSTLPLLVSCDGNDYVSVHYTKLPQLVDPEARVDVPRTQVERRILRPDCAYPDTVEVDGAGRLVVPYQFCSDEFDGASPACASFDHGADVYEVAHAAMDRYRGHYVFEAFKRDRLGFNPEGYTDRLYWRYFEPLRGLMQAYALERAGLSDALPDDGTPGNFWRSADGWGAWTVATTDTFNFFGEVLMTPEPGPYQRYAGVDGREAWYLDPYSLDAPGFTLPLGVGRTFATEWEFDSGYFWYDRIRVVGSFLDKVAAISELTDPETFFVGKDVSSDVRQFSINYSRLYPRQVTDTFAALMTDRWDRVAPVWSGGRLQHRPISGTITIPGGGVAPVDPQVGFTVQLYLGALGHAYIPGGWEGAFTDSARLWLDGSDGALTPALPTVSFEDPVSGKTYVAVSYKSGILETGIAARMVSRANELKGLLDPADPSTPAALRAYVQLMEAMRSLSELYKNPAY
ncbi:MAG: zinc-dependent metalloprotease, partial [Deltaproteobacteria bacterium]|nr:zinc-dependent metalloprotease [Deltaproteobacteria bacterium]